MDSSSTALASTGKAPVENDRGRLTDEFSDVKISKRFPMEAIIYVIAFVASLLAVDIAAICWGAESRPGFGDDRRR